MEPAIVFDCGSNYIKAGFSIKNSNYDKRVRFNDEIPITKIPILIGRPLNLHFGLIKNINLKPLMVDDEIAPAREYLNLSRPIENGIIVDEEDTSFLYEYILNKKLGLSSSDLKNRKLLMTCLPEETEKNITKKCEIIFDKIGLGYCNFESRAKVSLYSEGEYSGTVLDSGFDNTYAIPIYEDYVLTNNIRKLDIGGKHITDYLIRLLQIRGYSLNSIVDFDNINEIKEKLCFISGDFWRDEKLDDETTYYYSQIKLPDGNKISISGEKFIAPEILFKPSLINNPHSGIHEILFDCINVSKILFKLLFYSHATLILEKIYIIRFI